MTPRPLARADLITGVLLVAVGIAALVLSLDMPRFEERNINAYTVPGLVPGALGAIIASLGAALAGRAILAGGWKTGTDAGIDHAAGRRVATTLALTLGYAAVLIGWLPFWLATFLFVTAFVALFERQRDGTAGTRGIILALVYAGLLAAVVTYVFQEVFLVRLP